MKVFLMGLDGMTLKIIESYAEKDLLPNFKKVIDGGASGILRSTIPPITGPAWVSLATGKTPGKHRVFEFRQRNGYETTFVTKSTSPSAEPIWEVLSRNGKIVSIINVPFTYPPDEINGIMVSGLMTPNTKSEFTFPKQVKSEIFKLIPDYHIDINTREFIMSGNRNILLKEVFKITKDRRKLMNYFIDSKPYDLFFVAFVGPDRVQHFMWDEVLKMNTECVRYYKLLDDILGDVLKKIDDDSVLFVVSDHGFSTTRKAFGINTFFEERGLLHVRRRKKSNHKQSNAIFVNTLLFIYELMRRIKLLHLKKYLPPGLLSFLKRFVWSTVRRRNEINWKKTKVFSLFWHGVNLNLKGREPLGCVEPQDYDKLCNSVRDELLKVTDPETGKKIVKSVFRSDELYPREQKIDDRPDLLFLLHDGYSIKSDLSSDVFSQWVSPFQRAIDYKKFITKGILTDTNVGRASISGCHDMNGLFLAYGNVIKNIRANADIYDVMPTILYLMGLAIPEDIDGRVLDKVIIPEVLEKNEIRYEKTRSVEPSQAQMLREETEELERKLKGLGYLS